MLRVVSRRALSLPFRMGNRKFTHFPVAFWKKPTALERHFDWFDREMDRAFRTPFPFSRPILSLDFSDLPSPIVTEGGAKKFRLEFDVSRFKPEEVRVQTTTAEGTLKVEAKHEEESCKYEFSRTISVPQGTNLAELKCRFSSDGTLTLEAPFTPLAEPKKELLQDTDIPVQHN